MTQPGHLRVRVRAAGLNRADLLGHQYGMSGRGKELAGEVLEVGAGVEGWAEGDRVMGLGDGFASEADVLAEHALHVPGTLSWEEAGALPLVLATSHDALVTNGRLQAGERVLVHAATSGVGVCSVQLAALLGASVVFGTSRSAEKLDVVRAHTGVDLVGIDQPDFEAVATDVDVIVDNVGASVTPGNVAAAAVLGRIVQVGRLGGREATVNLDEVARKRLSLVGVTFRTRTREEVTAVVQAAGAAVAGREERVRPRIEQAFPLSELAAAYEAMAANRHVGKYVVVPD